MPKPTDLLLFAAAAAVALAAGPAGAHGRRDPSDIPPPQGAHPGQCFAKVREPDAVTHTREQILVRPAGAFDKAIPAVTRQVEKQVLVTAASVEERRRPAVFKTAWKSVTEPGRAVTVHTPARYRTVTERVLISPARTVWKEGAGRPVTGDYRPGMQTFVATGEVLCRVRIPARYSVHTRRVLVSPAAERTIEGRRTTRRVSERLQVSPETVDRVAHPATYRTVRETVVVVPARSVTVRTPPQWRVVERTRTIVRYGWRAVVCAQPARRPHPRPRPAYSSPEQGQPYGERG
ncbi:hypothetical protein BH09PSE2_BH09PSE2_08390 [soil metagenome]